MDEKTSRKLKIKLIITIILLILCLLMMGVGIWASQAGKDRFKGQVSISTLDIDGKVTAKINGVARTTGEGYESEKLLWDSENSKEFEPVTKWEDIDLTFADKNSTIEIVVTVENRKVGTGIQVALTASLGDINLETTEKVIGETNIIAYLVAPERVESAIDAMTPSVATYKVVMKVADRNFSVKATELNVSLVLTNPDGE